MSAEHGWTRHGHRCCDQATGPRPSRVARCGGPAICRDCAADAAIRHSPAAPLDPFQLEPWAETAADSLGTRIAELEAERDAYERLMRETALKEGMEHELRIAAEAKLEAWRPIVEAAIAWRQALGSSRELMVFGTIVGKQSRAMIAAVDALPPRNVDSTPPGDTDG